MASLHANLRHHELSYFKMISINFLSIVTTLMNVLIHDQYIIDVCQNLLMSLLAY